MSWSVRKAAGGYRLYFTETNYGTASATNVKVYKYNMTTGEYQYTTGGVVTNGSVTAGGRTWTDWADTAEDFRSGS